MKESSGVMDPGAIAARLVVAVGNSAKAPVLIQMAKNYTRTNVLQLKLCSAKIVPLRVAPSGRLEIGLL